MADSKVSHIFALLGPTDDPQSPLWNLRISPAIALICIILAETLWKSGFAHGICLGLAAVQLGVLCILSFRLTGVSWKDPQDATVQQLHITR